jgi:uncharacterized protein involved in propanediol utilization
MALTQDSLTRVAQHKAQGARRQVKAAEAQLEAANELLKEAIPSRDVEAITKAAQRTAVAEDEVREAAHALEAVDQLLELSQEPVPPAGRSGEGAGSLLPLLRPPR